ncbi:hypothetical protein RBB79_01240 [Tunturiibacter empetritectus]|uniref:Uncharacterized protein n=2 Tax=Tunturiibacter TaxID=3154218 RepID=A0A852VCC1_9BACT|nr:hypothetical protein [Edaphobacter lichenicola]NYF88114.1 hypothetical protein [Edaphobacter lichenicola]
MNEQIDLTQQLPFSPLDLNKGLQTAEGVVVPIAADRMYQFAALTAGLFLLFTLL